jgi:PTS system mannose-specific IIA component
MQDQNVAIVAGLNLPMLIRILNYPNLSLTELAEKAVSGGQEGVMFFQPASAADVAQRN